MSLEDGDSVENVTTDQCLGRPIHSVIEFNC